MTKITKNTRENLFVEGNVVVTNRRRSNRKNKKSNSLLEKFQNIFMPLIPLFIACGVILALNNILGVMFEDIYRQSNIYKVMSIIGNSTFSILSVLVGVSTSKEFGSKMPMLGGVIGGIVSSNALSSITVWGKNLVPGYGGVLVVIFIVATSVFIEKICEEILPNIVRFVITPILSLIILVTVLLFVVQPMCDAISTFLGNLIIDMISSEQIFVSMIGGSIASMFFLPLSVLGMNQILVPINESLLMNFGYSILFPAIATAGMAQVGATIGVIRRSKNTNLKNIAKFGLIPGIFGVGESLIYGVTLPLFKPFIGACLGAGVGGAIMVMFGVSVNSFSISGLPLALLISHEKIVYFILCTLVSYILGYMFTVILGFKDPIQ